MSRFWQFAHLSDKFRNLPNLSPVPRATNLYIGGLKAIHQDDPDELQRAGITHILSVIDDTGELKELSRLRPYTRLAIDALDEPEEDLLRFFSKTNAFIASALQPRQHNGAVSSPSATVLVHCAMGISRSATIVCAYLMATFQLSADQALNTLRESRQLCQPNEGFMEQLRVYERMLKTTDERVKMEVYEKWRTGRLQGKL